MKTIDYAKCELNKYYLKMTGQECRGIELKNTAKGNSFDDIIEINVSEGSGTITGSNERAVLIGVYKFFYELGFRFIRPGKDGEISVEKSEKDCTVIRSYNPPNRYRGVCSEGAISEENIVDMVEWLPKVGMNSYFMQFIDGHLFFEKWYTHKDSNVLSAEEYSSKKSTEHFLNSVNAIKRCGLIYQAVGHGWTTDPLKYTTYGDNKSTDEDIREEHRELLALVGGKRAFFEAPGNTHLCYSNAKARAVITNAIVEYLQGHEEVDILHFWLADSMNNHCECESCKKLLPSEWYSVMLNELDEKLTACAIDTKVVFLIYCDLLFAPQQIKIKNENRFILMYAPISRSFFEPLYTDDNLANSDNAPTYVRNKNCHPKTGSQFLHYLKKWQDVINTDSFAFDYHLMTFQYGGEPSFTRIARTIYDDMGALSKAGLNGNISCQLQRIFLPTSLPMYVMAERLFGSQRTFEEIEDECLSASFGSQWLMIKTLLHRVESFFLADYMCGKANPSEHIPEIEDFATELDRMKNEITFADENATYNKSLTNLKYFVELQQKFLAVYKLKIKQENYSKEKESLVTFINKAESEVQEQEDSLFRKEGLGAWI